MNISSVAPGAISATGGSVMPVGARNTSAPAPLPGDAAATATISPWATLMNRLQSIAADDPAKLAAVAAQLTTTVNTAASQATGDEKTSLTQFGSALQQVGKTGNVAALTPLHHHRNHAAKHWNGGTGALLSNLLQDIDTVLGPNATASSTATTDATSVTSTT
jgi:hypothetical protein